MDGREVLDHVIASIAREKNLDADAIHEGSQLQMLGYSEDLDLLDLAMILEGVFGLIPSQAISSEVAQAWKTVGDVAKSFYQIVNLKRQPASVSV